MRQPPAATVFHTVYDRPDGEQVEIVVGFDLDPGYRAHWSDTGGAPSRPDMVAIRWIATPDGIPLDFDALTTAQQERVFRACWAELAERQR